jgi:hypothetical protein
MEIRVRRCDVYGVVGAQLYQKKGYNFANWFGKGRGLGHVLELGKKRTKKKLSEQSPIVNHPVEREGGLRRPN